jgi:hypothetical protein
MLAGAVVRNLRLWRLGQPVVEVSRHPLRPGEDCELLVSLPGEMRLRSLEVTILCEEEARYRQGTDTRTEARCVHREAPGEARHRFRVPPGAMHSFEAANNKVRWLVRLEGRAAGPLGVKFKHDFPLAVHPSSLEGEPPPLGEEVGPVREDEVSVRFDRDGAAYQPGEELSGRFLWRGDDGSEAEAAELSVLWYTEGKGDEDLGVHHFLRLSPEGDPPPPPGREQRFAARLPQSPLSYDGLIVKVCWCVRVRVFLRGGGELLGEAPFRLGGVARAREAPP